MKPLPSGDANDGSKTKNEEINVTRAFEKFLPRPARHPENQNGVSQFYSLFDVDDHNIEHFQYSHHHSPHTGPY
jgi:hypothetical protein